MKSRKVILILLSVVLIFGTVKHKKINKYFAEERYYGLLVKLGFIKKCYAPYDFNSFFKQENINYEEVDRAITLSSLNKLLDKNIKAEESSKIQTITHHIYFTSITNPVKMPEFYIAKMEANFSKLNDLGVNWQHFIWTNNPSIFPEEFKNIKGVSFKNLDELKDHRLYQYTLDAISKGSEVRAYFMEASDIVRLLVLQKFGGIYQDIDYEIYNANSLFELMKRFDLIAGREFPNLINYYGNAFMVAKANHPVINEAIRKLEIYDLDPRNSNIPEYIKYSCTLFDKLYFNSPPLFTISYFKKNNIEGNNDIILPSWMVYNVDFAHSKNGNCDGELINKDEFNRKNKILSELLSEFASDEKYNKKSEIFVRNDIYYDLKERDKFEVIGADMFCGTWSRKIKNKKFYYWNWPFSEFVRSDED